ncbi:MAG TPA: helix-hairpin-helix domain-containing protein [Bacteroidales bacterium]|nr:helix-hairpin-helix domain-containing protein [Bacteroidales bacterium]
MKINYKPLVDLLGYSRRERRASLILIIIILAVSSAKYLFPAQRVEVKDLTDEYFPDGMENTTGGNQGMDTYDTIFDPNTASYKELVAAGLGDRQARTLISYRNSGARFRGKKDIAKVYGISEEKADSLEPYIKIRDAGKAEEGGGINRQAKRVVKPVELNSCDSSVLEMLPGIGPVLAARIIKFRKLLGGFYSVEQVREVYGLPAETYERISGMLFADTSFIERIRINRADYRDLSRIIYLDRYEINAILKYRSLMDSIGTMDELVDNKIIPGEKAFKVRHYLSFE